MGLEFAATARGKGLEVDVVELGTRVMARAVTAEISEFFQASHTAAGIRIHLGVQVTSIESDGNNVTGVSLSDGRHIPADLVGVGAGAFSAFCYKSGQLVGIESVNRAGDHMFGRRLLAVNGSIAPKQAADAGFDLKSALT